MSLADFKRPTLEKVKELLKPLGFRKTARLFSRQSQDVVHLIEIQGSRDSTSTKARFTVNVGVYAPGLPERSSRTPIKAAIPIAHWRKRLGHLCPENNDLWWEVSTPDQAVAVAADIANRLSTFALPTLATLPNLESLVALWKSGQCPGLTDVQRLDLLARLSGANRRDVE